MISGFLTSVIRSSDHASISKERLALIIDFTIFYSGFFSSEALLNRTNRVSTDVAINTLVMQGRCYLVRRSREVTNELGDNSAHRCVDCCFCKHAIISAAKVRHCKRKDCPDALFLCRENGGQRIMFSGIFMSYPQ